jgi:ABC-type amino acid transport substrate-binding protein
MKLYLPILLVLVTVLCSFSKVVEAGHFYSIMTAHKLRVCHWPAYYGISFVNNKSGQLEGIDIDLARELANDLEVELEFVQTSFATFIEDIKEDKCDIAMFGVAITSQRAEHLDFSKPYLKSDIYAVITMAHPTIKSWKDLDQEGHIIVVQKGTWMEDAAVAFQHASILSVVKFQQREKEVRSGRADAFLTDYPYGTKILNTYDWARLLAPTEPVYEMNYAYAVDKGDAEWLFYINNFVTRIKIDGRLKKYAEKNGLLPIAYFE